MLSLRGTLTRIIHVFSSEFLNVFTPLLRRRPRSLTFALWMPPTDGLRGRMQIRSDALLESLQWINCTDISYPFSCCSILGKRELRLAETRIMQEELYESLFCIFLKKSPHLLPLFRRMLQCWFVVKLQKKQKKNPFTVQFCFPPGLNLPGKWRLTGEQSSRQPGTISLFFHISILD